MLNSATENTDTNIPPLPWWAFWVLWVLTFVGGLIVVWILGGNAPAIYGLIVGMLQWFLLRKQLSLWWVVVTSIGFPIGFGIGLFFGIFTAFFERTDTGFAIATLMQLMGGVLGGTVLAISQWIVLRQRIAQANWWILAVFVGWLWGFYVFLILPVDLSRGTQLDQLLNAWENELYIKILAFNVIFGVVTGFVLVWLIYKPPPNKVINLTPKGLSVFSILTFFWLIYLFVTVPQPAEVIVPVDESPDSWFVSPSGDKLIYISRGTTKLLFPSANQKYHVGDCDLFQWINDTTLICFTWHQDNWSLVNIAELQSTGQLTQSYLKKISIGEFQSSRHSTGDETIYLLSPYFARDASMLLVIPADENKNIEKAYLVTEIRNLDSIANVEYKGLDLLPKSQVTTDKIYSPNGEFYYRLDLNKLAIYDQSNELLSEFEIKYEPSKLTQEFEIGGWAADSSGVYFKLPSGGGLWPTQEPIRKLIVP